MNDNNSLAHTVWNCKYHIVFAPKYRREAIYGQIRADIGSILRKLCEYKGVEIIEAETCPDHIHMLVSIPPQYSVSQFMGYLKGKSTLMIFDRHANLKYKYGSRSFWCRGYYVDTVIYLYGYCFQGGKNFAPYLHSWRFIASKGDFKVIFAPNSVNLHEVRVQSS